MVRSKASQPSRQPAWGKGAGGKEVRLGRKERRKELVSYLGGVQSSTTKVTAKDTGKQKRAWFFVPRDNVVLPVLELVL